jgi:hypothetical protein
VQRPDVKRDLRACPRIYVPTHRPVPLVALYADIDPTRVIASSSRSGCVIRPATREVAELAVLDPNEPGASLGSYGGPGHAHNRSWIFTE